MRAARRDRRHQLVDVGQRPAEIEGVVAVAVVAGFLAELGQTSLLTHKDQALNERDYPDSGLLCGGQLEIFVEPIVVPPVAVTVPPGAGV